MPTGYTAGVQDGTITEFRAFALQCARAMGALVMMRDDAMDAPIPDEFKPSTYYDDAVAKAKASLADLDAMTSETLSQRWNAEREETVRRWEQREAERKIQRGRYEAMLLQVRAWTPPSPDHDGLKEFMIEQLQQSIDFDCKGFGEPVIEGPSNWFARKKIEAERDVAYYTAERTKEIERAEGRTRWVRQLRESLVEK